MFRKMVDLCFLLLLVLPTSSYSSETERDPSKPKGSDALFPIHYGQQWGFINREGSVIITPQFDRVGAFFHGIAQVTVIRDGQRKIGFIDKAGTFVIEPHFDQAGDFLDEVAPVRIERRWGYIDRTGHLVVRPTFQAAGEFHEGLACVEFWNQIPSSGTPYLTKETAQYDQFPLLKDILRLVVDSPNAFTDRDCRFGFIDKFGRMSIEPQDFDLVGDFSDGLALFRRRNGKWGYLNRQGRPAFDMLFDYAKSFSEGLACVTVNGKTGFIDTSGRFLIPPQFGASRSFSEGIAVVTEPMIDGEEGTWHAGGIDKSGNVVIPLKFQDLSDFSEGLAIANSGRENFFIDRNGIRLRITDLPVDWWGFRDGLAIVGEKGKRVYVDKSGKAVSPFEKNLKW